MPWTPKQKRYLLSSGSPLTEAQKNKMKRELHVKPKQGSSVKRAADAVEFKKS